MHQWLQSHLRTLQDGKAETSIHGRTRCRCRTLLRGRGCRDSAQVQQPERDLMLHAQLVVHSESRNEARAPGPYTLSRQTNRWESAQSQRRVLSDASSSMQVDV